MLRISSSRRAVPDAPRLIFFLSCPDRFNPPIRRAPSIRRRPLIHRAASIRRDEVVEGVAAAGR
ncbi:hypothetical protein, partial [Polymorphospora lycopeni]|uniref:hypothetical protein n=1 Tax=Polymorphospora lycopeni TaxID=3140240 RepID=UPI0035D42997